MSSTKPCIRVAASLPSPSSSSSPVLTMPPPSLPLPLRRPTRRPLVFLLPLLLVVLVNHSSMTMLVVDAQQVCALPGYSLSPIDSRFCCPSDSASERFVLDGSSISDGRTNANCRSCRTSEATFNDCKDMAGGSNVCCAGQWSQYTPHSGSHWGATALARGSSFSSLSRQ
jgi:hypothetical protein